MSKLEPVVDTLAAPERKGRTAIERVRPCIDGGLFATKRIVGDAFVVEADIFTDGHESLAADLLLKGDGDADWRRTPMTLVGNDRWRATTTLKDRGAFSYCIEAWRDPFASWTVDTRKKQSAGQELATELREGQAMASLNAKTGRLGKGNAPSLDKLLSPEMALAMRAAGPRTDITQTAPLPLIVERLRARFSSWYELFPRSQSRTRDQHGTFRDVQAHLHEIRDLGFDVLYFPPIHPIGETNRKGRNNALKAAPDDVGSVYAIGSKDGGHDAVHPELGSLEDFRALQLATRAAGMELALDLAIQCSPDHPWIKAHPEWFEWRPDGTIKYAENPPKKYEDIVNLKFDGDGYPSVWVALRDVVLFWVEQGVTIFRVDNPHTKPLPFWQWLIADINTRNPDVIFLAEAFTRPAMMRRLAKIGFQQSYTYFTWRNLKWELTEYISELCGEMGEYYRPNFFVNTPDINPFYLQTSGRAGFVVRATLAATLSSNWGIYSGFEYCESAALPGREEYLDSEKYQLRQREPGPDDIRPWIRQLNAIRNDNLALQDFRNCLFLNAGNDQVIAYARMTPSRNNTIMVIANLDPHHAQDCNFEVPLWEFGLPDDGAIEVEDLVLGIQFTLRGKTHWIRLDPRERSAVIWRLVAPAGSKAG